jgi:hypothetical protein
MDSAAEVIEAGGEVLCYLLRRTVRPTHTLFVTPPEARQQVGFIVYPRDGVVRRHAHRPIERHLVGMSEVLVVQSGQCQLDLYDQDHVLVASRVLEQGDVVVLTGGGHGLRMLEDTVLLEIKQGPYLGVDDKELF